MSLYGVIILATITGPVALSFDKKVAFYRHWKALFPAIILVAVGFLIWDEVFTVHKIWGFTPLYLCGLYIGHLPIEEVMFFLVVPYACVFIYEVLPAYFKLSTSTPAAIGSFGFTIAGLCFAMTHTSNWYTFTACSLTVLLTIGAHFVYKSEWYGRFIIAFTVCLIPFLLVNGVLTGAVTKDPIVWYSEEHIMGPRILTIPIEDIFYNYAMLLPIVWLFERFRAKEKTGTP